MLAQPRGHFLTCHGIKIHNEHLQPGNFLTSTAFEGKFRQFDRMGKGGEKKTFSGTKSSGGILFVREGV